MLQILSNRSCITLKENMGNLVKAFFVNLRPLFHLCPWVAYLQFIHKRLKINIIRGSTSVITFKIALVIMLGKASKKMVKLRI